jgi:hypothetical protein
LIFFPEPAPLPSRGTNKTLFFLFYKESTKVQAKIPMSGQTATWNLVLRCCSAAVLQSKQGAAVKAKKP